MADPSIETPRLAIRHFELADLDAIHRILDTEIGGDSFTRYQRSIWLHWTVLNDAQLAALHQPPYGDRAVILRETGAMIGSVGLVPTLAPYDQLPYFNSQALPQTRHRPEVGLYWAIAPVYRQQGYATEAARGLIDFAFKELNLLRVVATTEYGNEASQAVMRRLGMTVQRNPLPDPSWFQVVGILENV